MGRFFCAPSKMRGIEHAMVWVNGWLVKRREGGYYRFREDITDAGHFGGEASTSS